MPDGRGLADRPGFFDRTEEQRLFNELVSAGPARVLTIQDRSGGGKSQLLKRLRELCEYASTPLPVALVPVAELEDQTPFEFARRVGEDLEEELSLRRFSRLMTARMNRDATKFAEGELAGFVDARNLKQEGDKPVVAVNYYENAPPIWTDELEKKSARACAKAFVDDLAELRHDCPVVLLIDSYEAANERFAGWLVRFVNKCILNPPVDDGSLVVVIAGQDVPATDFQVILGDRFPEVCRRIPALSIWQREHVRDFLEYMGAEFDEEDVSYLSRRLARGMTIEQAVRFVREYLLEERLEKGEDGER
jgi:hypothetical protein